MTFGFPAYHEETWRPSIVLDGDYMLAVANALGWAFGVEHIGPVGWRWLLGSNINWSSWGEKIIVEPQPDGSVRVRSSCILFTQCFDWGRNRRNIRRLAEMMQV